jgi:hypothetical protein
MRNVLFRLTRLGGLVIALIAIGAVAAAGSASAATQHWASSTQLPFGNSTEVTGTLATGSILAMDFDLAGAEIEVSCKSLSSTSSTENPSTGAAGTLTSKGFELSGCEMVGLPACMIQSGSIPFAAMNGYAYAGVGGDWIDYSPVSGSTVATLNLVSRTGKHCPIASPQYFKGEGFSVRAMAANPGEYGILPQDVHLSVREEPVSMWGDFELAQTSSGKAMVLSSATSPAPPHWYLGSAAWNNISAGKATTYSSYGPMSFDLQSETYGIPFEMSCTGTSNSIGGSLENPSGGGAGTASATLNLGGCTLPVAWWKERCVLHQPLQWNLSGVATEAGTTPALEFPLPEGSKHLTFTLESGEGKVCPIHGTFPLEGRLLAKSEGDGHFGLSSSELWAFEEEEATVSGQFALQNAAGESLRLQP